MEKKYDYLIVGSGMFGATFARSMMDAGKSVLIIDKRPHLGGNCLRPFQYNNSRPDAFLSSISDRIWAGIVILKRSKALMFTSTARTSSTPMMIEFGSS